MMVIDNKYKIGDIVYLKTDIEQKKRIVTRIYISSNGLVYELCCGDDMSNSYDIEISKEKDVIITTTN